MSQQIQTVSGGGIEMLRLNGAGAGERGLMTLQRANDAANFYERFTMVEAEVVRDLYKPREGLELVPIEADLTDGKKKVKFYRGGGSGKAEIVEGIDPKINTVDFTGEPIEDDIYRLALGFKVDIDELAASPMASEPWNRVRELAMTTQESLYEGLDRIILHGDGGKVRAFLVKSGIHGAGGGNIMKGKTVTDSGVEDGELSVDSTPDSIVDAFMASLDAVYEESKKTIMPNRLAISLRWRNKLARLRMTNTGQSALSYIVENSPYLASADDIVGISAFEKFWPAKGQKPARDVVLPYQFDRRSLRAKIQAPMQRAIKQFTYGQLVVWDAMCTPSQWKRPLAGRIYAVKYS